MINPEPEYCLQDNGNGSFTILQRSAEFDWIDYELELASHQEAMQLLAQINWLEEVYSPPRK